MDEFGSGKKKEDASIFLASSLIKFRGKLFFGRGNLVRASETDQNDA